MVKNLSTNAGDMRPRFDPWVQKISWRGRGNPLQYSSLDEQQGHDPLPLGRYYALLNSLPSGLMDQLSVKRGPEGLFTGRGLSAETALALPDLAFGGE